MIKLKGGTKVFVFCDSLNCVKAVAGLDYRIDWKLMPVVEKIRSLMKSFCFCTCLHSCREDILPTHIFGEFAVTRNVSFTGDFVNKCLLECLDLP